MVKKILKVLVVVTTMLRFAPVLSAEPGAPTVRALLTLTPGYLTAQKVTSNGVGGELEYFPQGKISLRSDAYVLAGKSDASGLKQHYQGFLGIAYNFEKLWVLSPFVGFQPGFGLAQVESAQYNNLRLMPVFSPYAGVHYFSDAFFHFTLNVRYVYGELLYPSVGTVSMSEIRVSFGLGIYL